MTTPMYDLVTVGRVNMDLYSQDIGAAFADITGFDAMVGGSPSNIAIATSRLGLRSIALTAVGDDRVGDFVLRYFRGRGRRHRLRRPQARQAHVAGPARRRAALPLPAVVLPGRPRRHPSHASTTSMRCPSSTVRAIQLSGNAYSRGTCADATRYATEAGATLGLTSFIDLDLRPTDWSAPPSLRDHDAIDPAAGRRGHRDGRRVLRRADVGSRGRSWTGGGFPTAEHDELDAGCRASSTAECRAVAVKRGAAGRLDPPAGESARRPRIPSRRGQHRRSRRRLRRWADPQPARRLGLARARAFRQRMRRDRSHPPRVLGGIPDRRTRSWRSPTHTEACDGALCGQDPRAERRRRRPGGSSRSSPSIIATRCGSCSRRTIRRDRCRPTLTDVKLWLLRQVGERGDRRDARPRVQRRPGHLRSVRCPGRWASLRQLEAQGYLGDPTARQTSLLDGWSVEKAKRLGASGIKLLVLYRPDTAAADVQDRMIAAVIADCARYDIPLFLEPLAVLRSSRGRQAD